jgi:hypothetical protein
VASIDNFTQINGRNSKGLIAMNTKQHSFQTKINKHADLSSVCPVIVNRVSILCTPGKENCTEE